MKKRSNAKLSFTAFIVMTAMAVTQIPVQAAVYNGWENQNGNWAYYNKGTKQTGWVLSNGKWYHMNYTGNMQVNAWAQDNSKLWFYVGSDGAMVTNGWAQDSSKSWFYLGQDGAMVTNAWAKDSSKCWFYLGADGAMVTNKWVTYKGHDYYLNNGGDMAENTTTPDGSFVDATGAKVTMSNIDELSDGGTHTGNYMISVDGTYGNADASKVTTINGNVTINVPNASESDVANLQNLKIIGTITVNFGAGTVNTTNVTGTAVKIQNIGSHCFEAGGGSGFGGVDFNDSNNDGRLVCDPSATIGQVIMHSGGTIQAPQSGNQIRTVIVDSATTIVNTTMPSTTEIIGHIGDLDVIRPANVVATANATIDTVTLGAGATLNGPGRIGDLRLTVPETTVQLNTPNVNIIDILQQAISSHVIIPTGTTVGTLNVLGVANVTGGGSIGQANIGVSGTSISVPTQNVALTAGTTATFNGVFISGTNYPIIPTIPIGTSGTTTWGRGDGGRDDGGIVTPNSVKATLVSIDGSSELSQISDNGGTLQFTAIVVPSNVTVPGVVWSVSDTSIATIDQTGLLKAKANGMVTVTATSKSSSSVKATCLVYVTGQTPAVSKTVSLDGNINVGSAFTGETIGDVSINGTFKNSLGATVQGTLTWSNPLQFITGNGSYNWTFTPTDTADYNVFTGSVVVAFTENSNTDLVSLTVDTVQATGSGTTYSAVFPCGTDLSTLQGSHIIAFPANTLSTVSTPISADGGQTWTFRVTAEDGVTFTDYTINCTIAQQPASADASVSNVKINGVDAVYSGNTYSVELPTGTNLSQITASDIVVTTTDSNATVSNIQITNGGADISWTVTAQDNVTFIDYTVHITVV